MLYINVTITFIVIKSEVTNLYIKELAQLSGVSTRTLRYYDEIGLLVPRKDEHSQYRIYDEEHVDVLQQILFYRELQFSLEEIKQLLQAEDYNRISALLEHKKQLIQKKRRLNNLLTLVDRTILSIKGEIEMSNNEKFEVFKDNIIEENESKYGEELRAKYGDSVIDASNMKMKELTESQFQAAKQLEESMFARLQEAMNLGDATSSTAVEVAELHKRWLSFYWPKYSKGAHASLAQMYLYDERFTSYYDDRVGKGATQFLVEAINHYSKL